jgi:hypothetical protein
MPMTAYGTNFTKVMLSKLTLWRGYLSPHIWSRHMRLNNKVDGL